VRVSPPTRNYQILEPFNAARCERMPQRWGGLKDRRASLLDRPRKRRRIFDHLSLGDDDTSATDEGKKQIREQRCRNRQL